ncbi:hypothetical protein NLJ89_g1332 [Agrocybe chaxingu]|uniref:Uncharacterized protein n=1 Tax=Agrocybe chaxingu TaxID=84603 RepID=A0A9W8TEK7_9AGAR|nr:hypothetical protein NLJ89_g1332 [Agrocybe chaxingu]
MTPDSKSSKSTTVFARDDDRDMLESLKGLSIKGFQDCNETPTMNTPSSTSASLPTPPALKSSLVFLASGEAPFNGHSWYSGEKSIPPPNAPQMKDLDSFTDGTGQGSFDFPLSTGADEPARYTLFFHPHDDIDDVDNTLVEEQIPTPSTATHSNSLALDLLPHPGPLNDVVQAWIDGVSATTGSLTVDTTPRKRRRSLTLDSEADTRRVRAWSPDTETASTCTSQPSPHFPTSRQEPEAPD